MAASTFGVGEAEFAPDQPLVDRGLASLHWINNNENQSH
jgi:hypothetical protein